MNRRDGSTLHQLEKSCPDVVLDARIVAGMLWRYRAEFRTMVDFDDLVLLAVAEVWFVLDASPTLTQTERVALAMQGLRRELRRTRAQLHAQSLESSEDPQLLERLSQRDLLRRLQQQWAPGDYEDLVQLCDDTYTGKELAQQRRPHGTAREVELEHGRLRKQKRRLVLRARADLDNLGGN